MSEPKKIYVEEADIFILTTGDPIEDLKWVVNVLHHEMPPVEVLGAMLCNVIDMLEGKKPEILAENVGTVDDATEIGHKVKKKDWN